MKRNTLLVIVLLFCCYTSEAAGLTAGEIVRRRDKLMRGETAFGLYEMTVKSPRWERSVKFRAWSQGSDKSFIAVTYPKKDKGTTFLRIKTDMWQYLPRIERRIKIPPSMMLQSWMGSDFTNDDLVKESSIVNDYTHKLLKEEEEYIIESVPRPEAAVVWGKIIQHIDKEKFVPLKDEFYDEDGVLVRYLIYDRIKKLPDRYYPMRWTIEPLTPEKKGHKTVVDISEIELNVPIDKGVFTTRALKEYSR